VTTDTGAIIAVIAIVAPVIGFFIKRRFFPDKSGSSALIQAGGDIIASGDIVIGNKTVTSPADVGNLAAFEEMLESHTWSKEVINHKELWICYSDSAYQIEIGEESGPLREAWTICYPDPSAFMCAVYLKINGSPIKEVTFVTLDGGRILVPLAEIKVEENERKYFWTRDSLVFKVGKVIGRYYIHPSIEAIARISNIVIE
jgi:hypothetical protein